MKELRMEAIKYKENTRQTEKKIVIECMKEIDRRRIENEESKWEKKRRKVIEKADMKKEELQKKREEKELKEIIREIM